MVKFMKRQSKSRTARLFNNIFRFRAWSDFDRSLSTGSYFANSFKRLFTVQEKGSAESFNEAMSRYNLTEQQLDARKNGFYRMALLMVIIAIGLFSYMFYNLFYGALLAALVSSFVGMLAMALAFRYHFWYYQLKSRKLGCSLKEWFSVAILGKKL